MTSNDIQVELPKTCLVYSFDGTWSARSELGTDGDEFRPGMSSEKWIRLLIVGLLEVVLYDLQNLGSVDLWAAKAQRPRDVVV